MFEGNEGYFLYRMWFFELLNPVFYGYDEIDDRRVSENHSSKNAISKPWNSL